MLEAHGGARARMPGNEKYSQSLRQTRSLAQTTSLQGHLSNNCLFNLGPCGQGLLFLSVLCNPAVLPLNLPLTSISLNMPVIYYGT